LFVTGLQPFGGDGWCDTINNRAYCQYDGGDCCPSTLSTRKVNKWTFLIAATSHPPAYLLWEEKNWFPSFSYDLFFVKNK